MRLMKTMIFILCVVISTLSFSQERIVEIHKEGSFIDSHVSLFLDNGKIIHFDANRPDLLKQAELAQKKQITIEYTFENEANNIVKEITSENDLTPLYKILFKNRYLLETKEFDDSLEEDRPDRDPMEGANLTLLPTYDAAQKLMDTFNGKTHDDSQCYNRAYMWNYEASTLHNVNLGKIWIFFTKKYIRAYNYKWWFHVAPFAQVNDANGRYILDRGFTMVPFNVTNWKDIFIESKAECTVIKDYRDYRNNQDEVDCYFIFSSQKFWQPYQLKKFVNRKRYTVEYTDSSLNIGYKDALRSEWDGVVPKK